MGRRRRWPRGSKLADGFIKWRVPRGFEGAVFL